VEYQMIFVYCQNGEIIMNLKMVPSWDEIT